MSLEKREASRNRKIFTKSRKNLKARRLHPAASAPDRHRLERRFRRRPRVRPRRVRHRSRRAPQAPQRPPVARVALPAWKGARNTVEKKSNYLKRR
jgi:hypothetical protein